MKVKESYDGIRKRVLVEISNRFPSDAAFERAASLSPKTVNNWRRRISNSYLKMLPDLATLFHMELGELVSEDEKFYLSPDEKQLIHSYRELIHLTEEKKQEILYSLLSTIEESK